MSTKDDFLAKVQKTIDIQQAKLEKKKKKEGDESIEAIDDIRGAISSLEPKLEQAKAKAMEIADAADDQWDNLKDSMEAGWDKTGNQLEKGWNSLTDSIKKMLS